VDLKSHDELYACQDVVDLLHTSLILRAFVVQLVADLPGSSLRMMFFDKTAYTQK